MSEAQNSRSDFIQKALFVFGMLVTGSVNTLSKKAQNDATAKGLNGDVHSFSHPWFQTAVMFAGELMCLVFFGLMTCIQKSRERATYSYRAINEDDESTNQNKKTTGKTMLLFIFPTLCDVLGTSFGGIGLLWVYASVWQMMRGSIIIFSGILSVIFLKRKLLPYRWIGMAIVAAGLCLVGVSSLLNEMHDKSEKSKGAHYLIIGLIFIIAGQFCNSVQMVVEEVFLKKQNLPALMIVGMEGMWGLLLMSAAVLPIMYFIPGSNQGSYENSYDALVMIGNNMTLLGMILLYWLSIAFYNFCGLSVTKKLTAVHRTLIDALRTILVWGFDISLYYATHGKNGESWNKYSYLQLIGFFLLVIGTVVYNGVVHIPGLRYESATPSTHRPPTNQNEEVSPLLAGGNGKEQRKY